MTKPKKTKRKFYKTEFLIQVLSEEPLPDGMGLGEVAYAITEGDCSGSVEQQESVVLNGQQAASALVDQGSSPEFFDLTPDGADGNGNRVSI